MNAGLLGIYRDEIFGPVLVVVRVSSLQEATSSTTTPTAV